MSGVIPVKIVAAGDTQPVGVDFGRNHTFVLVTASTVVSGGVIPMTTAVAQALGVPGA